MNAQQSSNDSESSQTSTPPVLPPASGEEIVTNDVHEDSPDRARKRLVGYFDILLEMHAEYKRNHKGCNDEEDQLLQLNAIGKKSHKVVDHDRQNRIQS